MKKRLLIVLLSLISVLAVALPAQAQVNIQQQFGSPVNQAADISKLVGSFLANANIVAGVIFLILIITAGYRMLNHAGDSQKFATGKDVITYALLGFLIIFAAYWIIKIVETITSLKII